MRISTAAVAMALAGAGAANLAAAVDATGLAEGLLVGIDGVAIAANQTYSASRHHELGDRNDNSPSRLLGGRG